MSVEIMKNVLLKIQRLVKSPVVMLLLAAIIGYGGTIMVEVQDEYAILLFFFSSVGVIAARAVYPRSFKAASQLIFAYALFYLAVKNIMYAPFAWALVALVGYSEGLLYALPFATISFIVLLSMTTITDVGIFDVAFPAVVYAFFASQPGTVVDAAKRLGIAAVISLLSLGLVVEVDYVHMHIMPQHWILAAFGLSLSLIAIGVFEHQTEMGHIKRVVEDEEVTYASRDSEEFLQAKKI